MGTLFSRQCEYALQAVLYLAARQNGATITIREMAGKLKVPYHFLGKILQRLTHHGLLRSFKGTAGGFALAVPPDKITLLQIIETIDGSDALKDCVLGFPRCSSQSPCALHDQWARSRDIIVNALGHKTIDQMVRAMKKFG